MSLQSQLEQQFTERERWALRRQLGIPNNRRLFVLACMDERLPVEQALGLLPGDAHVFRNAGGVVTDDVIRSALLTTQLFATEEIVIVQHTECGMMLATGEALTAALREKGVDTDGATIDPALPELKLPRGRFGDWLRTFTDVDQSVEHQVELLRRSPLIPQQVTISGWVYEVETGRLRPPRRILSQQVNTSQQMTARKAAA